MYLHHVTLPTGHVRRSDRDECDAKLLAELRPVVAECEREGVAELPTPSGLMILRRIDDAERPSRHVAVWSIAEPDGPALITLALAMRDRSGAGVWPSLRALAAHVGASGDLSPPPAPWLAAVLHLPLLLTMDRDDSPMHWLADAERCIAWAWIAEEY